MNSNKLKKKSFQGRRFSRQEKLIIDLFGPSPKSSPKNTTTSFSRSSLSINTSTHQKSSSLDLINTPSQIFSSTTKIPSPSFSSTSRTPSPSSRTSSPRNSWLYKTHSPRTPSYQYSQALSPDTSELSKIVWRLIPLDLSSIKLTRPPLNHLHKWDRRARRELSPRYNEEFKENCNSYKKLNSKERRKIRRKNMFNKV